MRARSRRLVPAVAAVAFGAATVVLFVISRGKWSDAIIDSGSEWIYSDALSRGQTLYRDVIYWFGPFTPYFLAAFFVVLGSSFRTLAIAGIVGSVGTLFALFFALRRVTDRTSAAFWTALAVPVLVFMPNAGGSIIGMGYRIWHPATFALIAISLASRRPVRHDVWRLLGVIASAALAGLSRTEWGILTAVAAGFATALRERFRPRFLREAVLIALGSVVFFSLVLGVFVFLAGPESILRDGHLFFARLPKETRTFSVDFSGIRDWRRGFLELLYSAGMWLGAFVAIEILATRKEDPGRARERLPFIAVLLAFLVVLAALGGASGAVLFSAAPLICLAAFVLGLLRAGRPRGAALGAFGLFGLLASHRRIFHIGDSAYVAPPMLFVFVSAAGLLHLALTRERRKRVRNRLRFGILTALGLLTMLAFAGRAVGFLSDPRIAIPGTGHMLSARPQLARDISDLVTDLRRNSRPDDGLVVFPEGQVVNFLAGRSNPLRQKLYIPGYVTDENEPALLVELQRTRPRAIVIWNRPTGEYGRASFGQDYAKRIGRWIQENYVRNRPLDRTKPYILFWRRDDRRESFATPTSTLSRRGVSVDPATVAIG